MNKPTITEIAPLNFSNLQPNKDGSYNPFQADHYHMGAKFSKTVELMFANHPEESGKYLLLVNKKTGERMRIDFPENWQ